MKTFGETRAVDGVDLRRARRHGLRRPRPERRRQDDHREDARHPAAARRRRGPRLRPRRRPGGRRGTRPGEPHRAVRLRGRGPDRHREPGAARPGSSATTSGPPASVPRSCWRPSGSATRPAKQVKHYSGGMRRRIDIAASILNTPDLLFLDEPTTGLDPRSRNQVWDIVRAVVAQGTTVLLTTQYLDEADQLASRIAVIDQRQGDRGGHEGRAEGVRRRRFRPSAAARRRRSGRRPRRCCAAPWTPHVQLEPDPVALTARVGSGVRQRTGRRRAGRPGAGRAGPHRHHRRQLLAGPAQPGRGVPRPHRTRHDQAATPTTPLDTKDEAAA